MSCSSGLVYTRPVYTNLEWGVFTARSELFMAHEVWVCFLTSALGWDSEEERAENATQGTLWPILHVSSLTHTRSKQLVVEARARERLEEQQEAVAKVRVKEEEQQETRQ